MPKISLRFLIDLLINQSFFSLIVLIYKICKYLYLTNKKKEATLIKDFFYNKNEIDKGKNKYISDISNKIELEIPEEIFSIEKNKIKKINNNIPKIKNNNRYGDIINSNKKVQEKIISSKAKNLFSRNDEDKYKDKENINPNKDLNKNINKEKENIFIKKEKKDNLNNVVHDDYEDCKYFINAMENIKKKNLNEKDFESPIKNKNNPLLDYKVELRSYYQRKKEREIIEQNYLNKEVDRDIKFCKNFI
jgi:hypothetical protein